MELCGRSVEKSTSEVKEPDFKGIQEARCRLNSDQCTTAPNSAAMTYTTSPPQSPQSCSDPACGFPSSDCMLDFMLPDSANISDDDVHEPSHLRLEDAAAAEVAPVTPRALPVSPRTPPSCTRETRCSFTPPPLKRKPKLPRPRLLQALEMKSLEQVRAALEANPGDASDPFWDHDSEPPLCCAVRLGCSAGIVKLLLEHGADPDVTDMRNRTPLQLLPQMSPPQINNAAWTPTSWPHANFLPALPEVLAQEPFEARASTLWHQEVNDLLAGGN